MTMPSTVLRGDLVCGDLDQRRADLLAHPVLNGISHVVDYLDLAPGFGIVRFQPPTGWVGRALRDLDLSVRYQLSAIGLRRGAKVIVNPHRDEKIEAGDELVLMGLDDNLAKLENA